MTTRQWFGLGSLAILTTAAALCAASAIGRLDAADQPARQPATAAKDDAAQPQSYIYELRTYTTLPGRLPALNQRFRQHTTRLFEKHGMKNVYYFTPVDQDDTLIYLLAHKSPDAAKASWEAFRNDPAWQQARAASEQDGRIVMKVESVFLEPTDYSPRK